MTPDKRIAQKAFPHRVDIAAPASGLADRLGYMAAWVMARPCSGHCLHGTEIGQNNMRFYFRDADLAAEFAKRWGGVLLPIEGHR